MLLRDWRRPTLSLDLGNIFILIFELATIAIVVFRSSSPNYSILPREVGVRMKCLVSRCNAASMRVILLSKIRLKRYTFRAAIRFRSVAMRNFTWIMSLQARWLMRIRDWELLEFSDFAVGWDLYQILIQGAKLGFVGSGVAHI